MKKYLLCCLLLISGLLSLQAQDNTKLTLEDAITGRYSKFATQSLSRIQWIPGTDKVAYMGEDDDAETFIYSMDVKSKEKSPILALKDFSASMVKAGYEEQKRFPGFHFSSADEMNFEHKRTLFSYSLGSKSPKVINTYQEGAENVQHHEKTGAVAYTIKDNFFVSPVGKDDIQVTEDGKGITNGLAAHRYEFGIDRGIFWGNTGNKVAWYRVDETMVTDYGMYDFSTKPAGTTVIKYPMAGDASHHASIGIFDLQSAKKVFLDIEGDPEQYLTNIFWSPDDQFIFVAVLNRDQNHLKLQKYNSTTGKFVKTLFERKEKTFVQPLHHGHFIPNNDNEFLWLSDRDGFLHLYKYNVEGEMLGQLTKGDWMVTDFHGFDETGRYAFISSTINGATERHTHRIDLKKGTQTQLTQSPGNHTPRVQPSGKHVLDLYQSSLVPMNYQVLDAKNGKIVNTLLAADNPMREVKLGNMKIFTIEASDGTPLYCRMITPPNFDESKQYPVINYMYGGPGVQLIRDVWLGAAPLWMYYAAQEGYIVFTLENRGSANRGRKFEQATFRQLGTVEVEDQLTGVKWLKSQPYVNGDRMGVHGWSYGGFMTTSMMTRAPGTFNAGVAGGPVIDWRMYEIMYTERFMDTPQTNKEGYETANLLNHVENLEGKLMLIHGTSDDVVLWQHSLDYIDKAIKSGVQVDYFVYPSHPHNVRGKDRIHLMRKVLDYLMENI